MTTVMDRHGGVHQWDLTTEEVRSALFWFNITSIEYGIEILLVKLTILMIYRRVFVPHRWNNFDIILRIFEVILISFYFSITVVKIFECNPRARIWNKKLAGTCINVNTMLNSSGMFNLITDILILLVPIKSVWNLKMKKSRKIRVVLIFTFGLIGPVFSLIGFLVREQISHSPDATYNQPLVLLWGTAEVSTGVIVVSLPPLSMLFHHSEHQQGPTQSILSGESNKLGSVTTQSRHKAKTTLGISDDDLLSSDYLELKDGSTYTVGTDKPKPRNVMKIVGGTSPSGPENSGDWLHTGTIISAEDQIEQGKGEHIVKTVRVEQSYL